MPTGHRRAFTSASPLPLASLLALIVAAGCPDDQSQASGSFGDAGDGRDPTSQNTGDSTGATATGRGSSDEGALDSGDDGSPVKLDVAAMGDIGAGAVPDLVSYIWVPNTGNTTVSKVNTTTGVEEARYHTNGGGGGPSSTAINQHGDLLIASTHGPHSLTKIAGASCPDRNGDGVVQTSTGHDDVLPWPQDECMLWEVQFPQQAYNYIGAIAWEGGPCLDAECSNALPNPRAWAAWRSDDYTRVVVARLDGATGAVLDQLEIVTDGAPYTPIPYRGAVNAEGDFWILAYGGTILSPGGFLIHVDSETLQASVHAMPQNGTALAIDAAGDPWIAGGVEDGRIWRFDTSSSTFVEIGGSLGPYSGAQFDASGRLWVASLTGCNLTVVDGLTDTVLAEDILTPDCVQHVAVSVDHNGFVWVLDHQGVFSDSDASMLHKVDPETHETVLVVGTFDQPNVRSDMTGTSLTVVTAPPG